MIYKDSDYKKVKAGAGEHFKLVKYRWDLLEGLLSTKSMKEACKEIFAIGARDYIRSTVEEMDTQVQTTQDHYEDEEEDEDPFSQTVEPVDDEESYEINLDDDVLDRGVTLEDVLPKKKKAIKKSATKKAKVTRKKPIFKP